MRRLQKSIAVALILMAALACAQSPGSRAPSVTLAPVETVTVTRGQGGAVTKVSYPEGKDMSFPFAPDEKLNVYTGDFAVTMTVRPLHTVQPGKYAIHGDLKYQACDNAACYPPKHLPVEFEVKVLKGTAPAGKNPAQSPHVHR
jgi:hypothetical protein